jgi:hypothetical protein
MQRGSPLHCSILSCWCALPAWLSCRRDSVMVFFAVSCLSVTTSWGTPHSIARISAVQKYLWVDVVWTWVECCTCRRVGSELSTAVDLRPRCRIVISRSHHGADLYLAGCDYRRARLFVASPRCALVAWVSAAAGYFSMVWSLLRWPL